MSLAKLGLKNLRVWDKDVVEEHNIPNQLFLPQHIGLNKALAIKNMVSWADIDIKQEFYTGQTVLGDVVFLLVDSMTERKKIFDNHIKYTNTRLMIETRTGSELGTILQINPRSPDSIKLWEARFFPDEEAEVSACGSTISVGPIGDLVSGYAVSSLMNWLKNDEVIDNSELTFCTTGDTRLLVN